MEYVNKGKRDILIFPKFSNINKIQSIRNKYDELAQILPPHITLAFPFTNNLTNAYIKDRLTQILGKYKIFKIKCKGISFIRDEKINKYCIFLNIIEGQDVIKAISKDIYIQLLNKKLPENYIPHITLGIINELADINLNDTFETKINEIMLETIGKNEESLIEFSIKLK